MRGLSGAGSRVRRLFAVGAVVVFGGVCVVGVAPVGAVTYRPQTLYMADIELQTISSFTGGAHPSYGDVTDMSNQSPYTWTGSIAGDAAGRVYLLAQDPNTGNNIIARFTGFETSTTFYTGCSPAAVGTDAMGNVYVSDQGLASGCPSQPPQILEYDSAGHFERTVLTGHAPAGPMSIDNQGDVFFFDSNIEEVPAGANPAAAPIVIGSIPAGANDLSADPAGDHVYVSEGMAQQQVDVYAQTAPGTWTAQTPITSTNFMTVSGVAVDGEGTVWIADGGDGCVSVCPGIWEFPAGSTTGTYHASSGGEITGFFGFTISPAVPVSAPSAPLHVVAASKSATTSTGSLAVTFTPPANNGGTPIASYTASCTSSNGGAAKSKTGTTSPIVVAGVTTAKSYRCTVKATNKTGSGPISAASSAVTVGAPAAPTAVHAVKVAAGQLKVTFTVGATNGAPITTNTATCTSTNGGTAKTKAGAASPLVVTALTKGKTYRCAVTSKNSRGTSPTSIASTPVTT